MTSRNLKGGQNFRFASRYSKGLAGNSHALGGPGVNVPIEVLNGVDTVYHFEDFILTPSAATTPAADFNTGYDYIETAVTAGAGIILVDREGVLQLDGGAGTDDGTIIQFQLASSSTAEGTGIPLDAVAGTNQTSWVSFGSRFRLLDVTNSSLFIGLADVQSTSAVLTATTTDDPAADHVGVFKPENSEVLSFQVAGAGGVPTVAAQTQTIVDNTYIEIAMTLVGTTDAYFSYRLNTSPVWTTVNGGDALVAAAGTAVNMLASFATIGQGAGDDLDIDYFWYSFPRRTGLLDDGRAA